MDENTAVSAKKYNPYRLAFICLALAHVPFLFQKLILSSVYFDYLKLSFTALVAIVVSYEVLLFAGALVALSKVRFERFPRHRKMHFTFITSLYAITLLQCWHFLCWFFARMPHDFQ
jgi:hypothetical protein